MRNVSVILILGVLGCEGPLTVPAVERLEPEGQKTVDESWLNMLSPPERLDRSLLLDTVLTNHFHQRGVDRLNLTSEKDVWGGRVIMTVYYDRAHPAFDSFTVAYIDAQGRERRRERYTFEEVKGRVAELVGTASEPGAQPAATPEEIERQRKAEEEMANRLARQILIRAATRPAAQPVDESEVVPP
ncbi:MAG TPA: hypothetical protein PLL20_04140 [Phycisphaerae bacterium]|nr:hypothetical protein [Phycisphaerae bacterium]HRR84238.1 hypothetical protein [Phycisphaerae bacterium]